MMIIEILNEKFAETYSVDQNNEHQPLIIIDKKNLLSIVGFIKSDPRLYFDYLSCIAALDNLEENRFEIIYHFNSIPLEKQLILKVLIPRVSNKALSESVPSLTGLFKTADWQEREIYDLYGIPFEYHPDLRRILMPNDWVGFPLRKDYDTSQAYHGITIDYEAEN